MKRLILLLLIDFLAFKGLAQSLQTLGAEILGQSTSEEIGETLDISRDGTTYIVSSTLYSSGAGQVAVLELSGDDYSLKGSPIIGAAAERIGLDVSIDADGSVIAFSSNRGSLLGTNGFARVYSWNGSAWVQKGSDITEAKEGFGSKVVVSAGGNIVAVSAPFENSQAGAVYVYEFDGSDWVQVGNSFSSSTNYSGFTLAMSDDGTKVAMGHSSGTGTVAVYQNLSNVWMLMGSEITGSSTAGDYFGARLSLSGDGGTIAISAYASSVSATNKGMVEVFEWDTNSSSWVQKGAKIEGAAANALFGFGVTINTGGDVMAIAEFGTGQLQLYTYDAGWTKLTSETVTTVSSEGFVGSSGEGLALMGSGYRCVVGIRRRDNGAIVDAGAVQVYTYGYQETASDILCPATTYTFGSQSITTGGSYIEMLSTSEAYDSLVYLTLTENDLTLSGVSANSTANLCYGDANGVITITANSGSLPYEYSIGSGFQSSGTMSSLSAGSYTASVRDAEGCIVSQSNVAITGPSDLILNLASPSPVSCSGASDGSISFSAAGGTSPYDYSLDGVNFQDAGSFDNLTSGTYDLYASDANGCSKLIGITSVIVGDTQNPVITSSSSASFDEGGSGVAYAIVAEDNCSITSYAITGGDDASLFNINTVTGEIEFDATPDYANPLDVGKDNVYELMVEVEDYSGNVASQAISITVEEISFSGFPYTWDGSVNTDWYTSGNWDIAVPSNSNHVKISPSANQPVLASSSVVIVQDIAVISGANVTLESGATLQINGNVLGNGSYTIKRNSTGNLGYSIVGSPISDATISDLNANIIYDYDGTDYFVPTGALVPGKGYFVAYQSATPEISLTGSINTGTITVPLHADGDRFNIVANPYAAPISRPSFLASNDQNVIDGNIWFWNDGGTNYGSDRGGDYILVNNLGQVSSVDLGDGIPGLSTPNASHDRIPSFQGFLVRSQQATNLTFEQAMQANLAGANDDGIFYRKKEVNPGIVKLSLSNKKYYNELIVGVTEEATFGEDFAIDGPKLSVNPAFSFHSLIGDKPYAIQGVPLLEREVVEVALGMTIKESGQYLLKVDELENLDKLNTYLIDKLHKKSTRLTTALELTLDLFDGSSNDRYALVFSPQSILGTRPLLDNLELTYEAGVLAISGIPASTQTIFLMDLSGKVVAKHSSDFGTTNAKWTIDLDKNQVYILKAGNQSIKFILH